MREALFFGSSDIKMKVSYIFALIVLTLGCWLSASFLWGALGLVWLPVLAIVALLLISTLVWGGRKMSPKVWIYAGLFALGVLFLPTSTLEKIFPARLSQWLKRRFPMYYPPLIGFATPCS